MSNLWKFENIKYEYLLAFFKYIFGDNFGDNFK